jgi:transposase
VVDDCAFAAEQAAKFHALVDTDDLPITLQLTDGLAHDGRSVADMLDGIGADQMLLADRAYDGDTLRQILADRGVWANIKPMPDITNIPAFSALPNRYRNLVDCFFNKIKHFEAVASRHEKHDANYFTLVKLASTRI